MSFWSFSWKTLKDRGRYFHSRWGGARPPAPGAGNPAAAACMAATICANRAAPAVGGPGGPASPTDPTHPGGPGGGGGGGGGVSPPPGPPPLPLGGTGVAILNTQHSSRLNLTLLVDNWLIDTQLSTAYASI